MDPRSVLSYSLLLCIIGVTGVRSSEETSLRSLAPTLPTEFTEIPDSESSETKYSSSYKRVPNDLHEKSSELEDDVDGAPPDHVVPYSAHESPEEQSRTLKYSKPGDWAKPKADRDIPLDFVPTKLYAQVRGTHTVKRLPREEALKSAETAEEILAAPRLREVVSKSKTNTIYTEEGYEDAAYDHAGHVRDADFHEGFARKLKDQRGRKNGNINKLKNNEKEDIKLEESDTAEEFNDYDDDYSNHAEESSTFEEPSPKRRKYSDEYKKLKRPLTNFGIDPKQVTENGIEKLEEDLNKEYEESEKNTENEIPENLKSPENDDDEEEDESVSEDEGTNLRNYGSRISKKIAESEEASRAILEDTSGKSLESGDNDIRRVSSSPKNINSATSQSSVGLTESNDSKRLPGEFLTTPDYGKLFWDYYKTDASNWKLHEASTPNVIATTSTEPDKLFPKSLTSVPSFSSVKSTIGGFDTFPFTPSSIELGSLAFSTTNKDALFPSATSFYESWKRRDRNLNNQENEHESFDSASNIHPTVSEESTESDNDPALSLRHGQSATTLIGPKKLSYTVIIRSNDKTTTRSPPCDHEDHSRPEETNSEEKLTNPGYAELSNQFEEEVAPEAINGFDAPEQDFTVLRPPLPAPLGQVTFADFLPDPYGILIRPSVTQENGVRQEINGERDGYKVSESPYDYPLQNHIGHASEGPHVRHHRGPPPGRKRYHHYPLLTKLVPPSPVSRSKYADYLGIKRNVKPKTRFDRSSRAGMWPDLLNFYRSMDRTIFGRRRRRSINEEITKMTVSNVNEKVNAESADMSRKNYLLPERNFFDDETNRLVAASAGSVKSPSDDSVLREKSGRAEIRKRRSDEDLLNESPRIAEEVINAEIETRFKDEEDDEQNSNEDDDSSENERAKIEVEVPDFNFSEVIENNKRQKIINARPSKVQTLDLKKYPFYGNSEVSRGSALKYITNPRHVPRKTLGGTEFYDSRDRYLECANVEPDLDKVVPEEEESDSDREQRGDQARLGGLGDKLDCFRAKYFDENPLDNPLFLEKQVGEPRIPEELDPAKFASRIIAIPSNHEEEQVARKVSRKPEVHDLRRNGSKVNQVTRQTNQNARKRVNEDRNSGRERSRYHRGRERFEERGTRRRPVPTTTEPPDLAVTPYQREVYEDVMGTIKNLAGLYQTFGESVSNPSIQQNINHLPVTPKEKNWAFPMVDITERPRGFTVRGMLPPQQTQPQTLHRYRIIPYRTNKVSYGRRVRTEIPPGPEGMKIGYFKTVRVHKRSLNDEPLLDVDAEESRSISVGSANSTGNASKSAAPEKIVYTIGDRIRHSKPRGDFGRNGKFTNLEAAGIEDVRRREPRYNRIRHRKGPSSTGEPIKSEEPTVSSLKKPTDAEITPRHDFHDEPGEMYKIQFSTPQRIEAHPTDIRRTQESLSSEDYEEGTELDEEPANKTRNNNYDVRENVEEDVTTPPAILELQKYLETDPPGYSEAFGEKSTEPSERFTKEEDTPAQNDRSTEKEEEDEDRDEQVERPSKSYVEEESSPDSEDAEDEPDTPGQSESYKNANDNEDDENDEEEKDHSPKDEGSSHIEDGEKEFQRFASRPYSPFESNEDPKYSDLGPRLSKPSFHHPSFSESPSSSYRSGGSGNRKYSAESENESSEEGDRDKPSRYIFPWEEDEAEEEGVEESKHSGRSNDRYEYPWEKRERLARERRRKQKEREKYEKLYGFPDSSEVEEEDDEPDASNSDLLRRRIYPWEHYKVPSKNSRRVKASRSGKIIDNDEMGSEYRPVTKFSSKYKSRRFNLNDEDPILVAGADPREIRVSVTKSIENASKVNEKSSESDKNLNANPRTSIARIPSSTIPTIASRRSRRWKSRSTASTSTTTIRSTPTTRKPRIWRVASSTTKKPSRSHTRPTNLMDTDLLKSGTQNKKVITNPTGRNDLNSSVIVSSTTASTINRRNLRRRSQSANRSSTTKTTAKPVRRRLQKATESPKEAEASTVETVTERATTPKSKTTELRSSFSKEEIITKTSYPRMNPEEPNNDKKDKTNGRANENKDSPEDDKSGKESMNERVEKVSITTKETPEHIYRKEEIDKDGIKGMFVSITPNNETNSPLELKINVEDAKEMLKGFKNSENDEEDAKGMLKRFEPSEDDEEEIEEGLGGSFVQDSYLLANLLRQVPPYMNDLTLDENVQGRMNSLEDEGNESAEMEDDSNEAANIFRTDYVKDPNHRLYYYVEN